MKTSLIIAGGGLGIAALVTLGLRRQFLLSAHRAIAQRQGWTVEPDGAKRLYPYLSRAHLLSIGHSRRLAEALHSGEKTWVFPYTYDTGFEHRMQIHRWLACARRDEHGAGRATITSHTWLLAAAKSSWSAQLNLRDFVAPEIAPDEQRVVIVDDADEWRGRLDGKLTEWLVTQPVDRSWEILPQLILGYEPGSLDEQAMSALATSTGELFGLLENHRQT